MANVAIFVLALLAAARLNRLLVRDIITAPLRVTLSDQQNPVSRFASAALSCVWCTGVYTATATAAYAHHVTGVPWRLLPLTAAAIAWCAPVLAERIED